MEVLFSERALLLEGFEVWPICTSGKSTIWMTMNMVHWWNDTDRAILGEIRPSGTLPTTILTWTDLGSNAGLRDERPAANGLSYHTAG